MPPEQQPPQNSNTTLCQNTVIFTATTIAAVFLLPTTLAAGATLLAATTVGTGSVLLARRRDRQYDPEVENIYQNRRLSPPAEFQNNDNNFEDNQNHIAFVADNFSPSNIITDREVFIKVFEARVSGRIAQKQKGPHTTLLKQSLGSDRLARILQNMITQGYASPRAAKDAAKLIWEIKEGRKTIDGLSAEEKQLLKIGLGLLQAGADVPWWPDNDDDDNDPASSAATAYDDNDDDNPGAGSISYVMDNNDDYNNDSDSAARTEYDNNEDDHTDAISYRRDNSENQNISTLKLDTDTVNIYINQTICNDTTSTTNIYTTIGDDVLTKHIPLLGHLAIASEV